MCRALPVQRQQGRKQVVVVHGRIPAVGGEDGGVQLLVCDIQPSRALVVEARQVPGLAVLPRQPFVPLGDQFPRGVGDGCSGNLRWGHFQGEWGNTIVG